MDPYRAHELPRQRPEPPDRLVYVPSDPERHVAPLRKFAQKMIAGTVVAAVSGLAGAPMLALVVFGGAFAWGLWAWKRARDVSGTELVIEEGSLLLVGTNRASPPLCLPLKNLRNVELDTKQIERVQGDPRFAVSPFGSHVMRVAPPTDVSRVVFILGKREAPVELTEAYISHTECVEWLGRIRTFLRSHGWLPQDERGKPADVPLA